jgi:hypothetical protein
MSASSKAEALISNINEGLKEAAAAAFLTNCSLGMFQLPLLLLFYEL